MKKRILYLALALCTVICLMFSSCGDTQDTDNSAETTQIIGNSTQGTTAPTQSGNDTTPSTDADQGDSDEGETTSSSGNDQGDNGEGNTTQSTDIDNGEEDKDDEIPHTHSFSEWTVSTPATCTENGEKVRECTCGEVETDVVLATGHSFENGECKNCHTPVPYERVDNKIYFGTYPQTQVEEAQVVEALNDLAGELPTSENANLWIDYGYYISNNASSFMWYIDIAHGGEMYRGVYYTSYRPNDTSKASTNNHQEKNGYTSKQVYWFKYEAISWTILNEGDGVALLLCDMIIDSQSFHHTPEQTGDAYANNYEYSDIRAWLNEEFYNTAFNELQKSIIVRALVDNSSVSNKYACADTSDNVFLLSKDEITNSAYGFLNSLGYDTAREKVPTDYAVAQGANVQKRGTCGWILRTPDTSSYYVITVDSSGSAYYSDRACSTAYGIVPAIMIKL